MTHCQILNVSRACLWFNVLMPALFSLFRNVLKVRTQFLEILHSLLLNWIGAKKYYTVWAWQYNITTWVLLYIYHSFVPLPLNEAVGCVRCSDCWKSRAEATSIHLRRQRPPCLLRWSSCGRICRQKDLADAYGRHPRRTCKTSFMPWSKLYFTQVEWQFVRYTYLDN